MITTAVVQFVNAGVCLSLMTKADCVRSLLTTFRSDDLWMKLFVWFRLSSSPIPMEKVCGCMC